MYASYLRLSLPIDVFSIVFTFCLLISAVVLFVLLVVRLVFLLARCRPRDPKRVTERGVDREKKTKNAVRTRQGWK